MNDFKDKVVYQIYPKSFMDSNGDGFGDLKGVTAKLDYLADLGVDYLWLTPFFPSPQRDNGYDVADYRAVDPRYGTMEDLEELIREADRRGIGLMLDMVFNHTSTEHEWFKKHWRATKVSGLLHLQGRHARLLPDELGFKIRRPRVGIRTMARQMVSAPVRCDTGRPELGEPGGAGRNGRHPPFLEGEGNQGIPL